MPSQLTILRAIFLVIVFCAGQSLADVQGRTVRFSYSPFPKSSINAVSDCQTIEQLCNEYTSKGFRPNGQHCYIFIDTVLVCGVGDRQDGLYQMPTSRSKSGESQGEAQLQEIYNVSGNPYEVQCPSLLAYLKLPDAWQEVEALREEL
jgi:hypothetical protein